MNDLPQTKLSSCPSCTQPMTRLELPHRIFGTLVLDLCFPCQGIWFDQYESVQINPGGIIDLFKLIHAHRSDPRQPHPAILRCPRCRDKLFAGLDVVRSGRFTYHRCLQNHGRFTSFAQFMIEKGFVRQLAPAEITALAARIGTFHCTGCGAPIDIRTQASCNNCGSPISILDPEAVEKALADYQQKESKRTRLDPETLADSILAIEKQRRQQSAPHAGALVGDLFLSGIEHVSDLFP